MLLKQSFQDFISKISLDDSRTQRIISAHTTMREFLSKDEELKNRYIHTFLQGSYKINTAVKPQNDGEYDVDVILAMNFKDKNDNLLDSARIKNWIAERIKTNGRYKDKVEIKNRCIRIQYSGDGFHMDITPAHCNGDVNSVLQIPPDWKETHPRGFRDWCINRNKYSNGLFIQVTKLLKWWRNIRFGDDGFPKSIVVNTLVGTAIPETCDSIDDSLIKTMQILNKYFQQNISVPRITNPSLESENISSNWGLSEYLDFKEQFKIATDMALMAKNEKDEEKTIEIWNSDALFKDTFPKEVRGLGKEAKEYADAMKENKLKATSTGAVGIGLTEKAKNIPPTKFYD